MDPYGSVWAHIKTGRSPMAPDHFQTPLDPKKGHKNPKSTKKLVFFSRGGHHPGGKLPMGPPRKITKILAIFGFFRSTQKNVWEGPRWGREVLFPANPDLAKRFGFLFGGSCLQQSSWKSSWRNRLGGVLPWRKKTSILVDFGFLWPFLGSRGFWKWSWAIGLRPVLIWPHIEPYGPISDQIPWFS